MNTDYTTIALTRLTESPFQGRISTGAGDSESGVEERSYSELRESIRLSGLLTPILVRRHDDMFEIIDGHRRVAACRELGWENIPSMVTDAGDKEAQAMTVIGNLHRRNLKTVELALAYSRILESGLYADKKELSAALGKDETYVGNVLNTLKMDRRIVEDLLKNNSVRDLKILRAIRRSEAVNEDQISDLQWNIYNKVVGGGLSRAEIIQFLRGPGLAGIKPWKTRTNAGSLNVRIPTAKMSAQQREALQKLVDEKLAEVFEKLYKA